MNGTGGEHAVKTGQDLTGSGIPTSGEVEGSDLSVEGDVVGAGAEPGVPEANFVIVVTADDCGSHTVGRDQVVAGGSGEFGLDTCTGGGK